MKAKEVNKTASEKVEIDKNLRENEIYQAMPAQIVEDLSYTSYESQSNPSLQSVNTTTSEDSDTVRVYDFTKQETTIIRSGNDISMNEPPKKTLKKERPTELKFSAPGVGVSLSAATSPFGGTSRGSTPTAFKFLQPKRKLIEPNQVLSFDEDDVMAQPAANTVEKSVIEEDIAHAMPKGKVKALAQAFLLTSNKSLTGGHMENCWLARAKSAPVTPNRPLPAMKKFKTTPRVEEPSLEPKVSNESLSAETIASSSILIETKDVLTTSSTPASETPEKSSTLRAGFLKSNIAFFENLKFEK